VSGPLPGKVRIVAGAKRGRRIRVAPRSGVRPTSEYVREAIFNALGPVTDLIVLDLFAGTGAMGLEALSRGAAACIFVEDDRAVAEVLRENIRTLDYDAVSTVIGGGYPRALTSLIQTGPRFDLLFVDPPYRMLPEVEVMLTPLVSLLLATGGVVVIEGGRSSQVTLGHAPVFERVYGETKVTMVKIEED
jgi:16S rRNA (guanine966-N2)-methyltransferase